MCNPADGDTRQQQPSKPTEPSANKATSASRKAPASSAFFPHLTTCWLTLGMMFPSWGPVAVFGVVLNINFIVVIAVTSDFKFGRDLLYEQVPRFVDWPLLFRLPGWVLDISVLAAHLTVHVLPAVYFCLVQSAAVAARDALLSVLVIPVWCSLATGALVRKGVPITWCNCSPLYARRSDEFWRFAFRCSYTSHAVIA